MQVNEIVENKISDIISKMTVEEKVGLCHANSKFTVAGVERLGIDELVMSDGPHGVRGELERHSWTPLKLPTDLCTYLPTGTAVAATFNPELGRRFGEVLGSEARFRGKDIILGPGVNIIRTPLCGRNFEYMSEDPCLIQKMASGLVQGIESQDTAACVKHYCLNNQELDRNKVNVEVSRRALHEIYLKGFYSAVIEGGASSVMGAYNRFENQHCCHNQYLVNDILKDKWGFDGVYLTDWAGAHDTDESIFNGLDIEMGTNLPYNEYYLADAFIEKAKTDIKAEECLNEKVRRILRLMFKIKKLGENRLTGEFNTAEHQQTAAEIAAEAMVLLKNEGGLLPLPKMDNKKILVIGNNAIAKHAEGGSSSGIRALYEVTPYEGITNYLEARGDSCEIRHVSDTIELVHHSIPTEELDILDLKAGTHSCLMTAFKDGRKEVICVENVNIEGGNADKYQLRLAADIKESGVYSLKFTTNVDAKVVICGKTELLVSCSQWHKSHDEIISVDLKENEKFSLDITVERASPHSSKREAMNFSFGWLTPSDCANSLNVTSVVDMARQADYVIYCAGLSHSYDTEGFDRNDMKLPVAQQTLLSEIVKVNKNTVVTVTAGSPVEMPWIDEVKSVVWEWYAGMESGNVLAKILFGDICPSGKMPFTLPERYEDHPVARYGEYLPENCRYNEDIFVGYRGFDRDNIVPLFPFGHGLSYAEFQYSDILVKTENGEADVTFTVKNNGNVTAKEVAQVYIGDPVCSVERPVRELRNFSKLELCAGESKQVTLHISKLDLSFFDEKTDGFTVENGEFTVEVGSSSRDIRLKTSFVI